MAALTQTITIVDKSNKVMSTSKQLKGVFTEAKYAYLARKAEIKAERKRKEEVELQKAIRACTIADDEVRSQVSSASRTRRHERRPESEYEGTRVHRSGSNSPPAPGGHMSLGQFNEQLYGPPVGHMSLGQFNEQLYGPQQSRSAPVSPRTESPSNDPYQALQRRQTEQDYAVARRQSIAPRPLNRSYTAPEIDLDLAYGEFHEADLAPTNHDGQLLRSGPTALAVKGQDSELSSLVLKCKMLLEEADCAGQSVKAIIMHLQTNPDAMAAVALTLAEISNIASKMAPGALAALKGSAPAVLALLASPEFLVAVGVGIGVTVVMLGGYKIIKKIKASAEGTPENVAPPEGVQQIELDQGDELLNVKELDRIEQWRRGIADTTETGSVVSSYSNATSVEDEFITPFAAQSMGHLPLKEKSKKSTVSISKKEEEGGKKKKRVRRHREHGDAVSSDGGSSKSDSSKRKESKELIKIKKPSPLRKMFTVSGMSSNTGWEK